jgi:polysaccharide pyruvyl transferase WcaK-like protein
MIKKALIINDTSNAYHWGCYGTSTEIQKRLENIKYSVSSFGVEKIYNLNTPPKNDNDFYNEGFMRVFINENSSLISLIKESDLIIINGEGSLHDINKSSFNLLYVSFLAKNYFNKKVHLINTSLFPSSQMNIDKNINNLYNKVLSTLDTIVVRETSSYSVLSEIGLNGSLGFDCLPLYLNRLDLKPSNISNNEVIIGGGLGLNPEIFFKLISNNKIIFNKYKLIYLTGAPSNPANDDIEFIKIMKNYNFDSEHRDVKNFNQWVETINNAHCLISGRFHHTIASACLKTPSIVFNSATPKNTALCKMLGLSGPLDIKNENILVDFSNQLDLIEKNNSKIISSDTHHKIISLGLNNFTFLE